MPMQLPKMLLISLLCSAACLAADIDPSALQRCAAIASDATRLQCYDTLAGRPMTAPQDLASTNHTLPTGTAASTTAPAATEPASSFGLSATQLNVAKPTTDAVQGRVVNLAESATQQLMVTLDNGQVWQLTGEDAHVNVGEQVTIRRAALGSFLLITKLKFVYRAHVSSDYLGGGTSRPHH